MMTRHGAARLDDRHHRRLGPLRDGRAGGGAVDRGRHAWGAPSDELLIGRIDGVEVRLPAAPRPRPPHSAERGQCPRQYRRAEARRLHRPGRDLGGRVAARGAGAGPLRRRRPVHRPHLRARRRASSATGLVAHVSMAEPVCPRLSGLAADAAAAAGARWSSGGTYLAMEGPQFSTARRERSCTGNGAAT